MNRSHSGPGRNYLRRDALVIRTTGVHIVRRMGDALLHAHRGALAFNYRDREDMLRANWTRDAA